MNLGPETRPSLLVRLADQHDDAAWREFLEIYEPIVYRLARSQGLQDADARDVTQSVLIQVTRQVGDWDPDRSRGSFRAWLCKVARHTAINALVRQARHFRGSGDSRMQSVLNQHADAAESRVFDLEFRRQTFLWAARKIEPEFRATTWQAFWRTCVEGEAPAEVAQQLGVSIGSVYVARSRCMARLREKVTRHVPNGD